MTIGFKIGLSILITVAPLYLQLLYHPIIEGCIVGVLLGYIWVIREED